jgi:hypothetical protein
MEGSPRAAWTSDDLREARELIRKMSREDSLWGAPRIHGELLKLGIHVGETSVGKCIRGFIRVARDPETASAPSKCSAARV